MRQNETVKALFSGHYLDKRSFSPRLHLGDNMIDHMLPGDLYPFPQFKKSITDKRIAISCSGIYWFDVQVMSCGQRFEFSVITTDKF